MKYRHVLLLSAATLGVVQGQRVGAPSDDLDKVSVDELFGIQVTSVGRKAQKLSKAPAAVFVLTADDIRRTGATSIPEALQWVPGLTVLRLDGRSWVVSARGGARLYSDKILVMIDGRSLYTPLYSGVIWDAIDVPLGDIEQIEVVRGPGAVMWGPNAVNGVINIITRRAQDTRGVEVSAAAGNEVRGSGTVRVGSAPGDRIAFRVWGKSEYRTPAFSSPGYYSFINSFSWREPSIPDLDWGTGRTGFRMDGQLSARDEVSVQGDLFKNGRHDLAAYALLLPFAVERVPGHTGYEGGYLQTKWTRTESAANESVLQFSYDRNDINYPFVTGPLNNLNLDYQKRRQAGERNEIYWGGGYQQYWDDLHSIRFSAFNPPSSVYRIGHVVLRDEWQVVGQRLLVSAGVRADYSSLHRLEYQPSLRLLYTPDPRQSAWVAASRAVRTPNRFDRDIVADDGTYLIQGLPVNVGFTGTKPFASEVERSGEAGYRRQSGQRWSVDASVFFSYYERLRALAAPAFPTVVFQGQAPRFVVTARTNNAGAGHSYGGELWATWRVHPRWQLMPSYSYLEERRWLPPVTAASQYAWDGHLSSLKHQGTLRSQIDLRPNVQLDLMARARSRDPQWGNPGALLLDARLAWRPLRASELSLTVRDLSNRQVLEGLSEGPTPAIPLRRTLVLKLTQRF